MYISTSLSKTPRAQKTGKATKKKKKSGARLSKDAFLKLGSKEQDKYLSTYPQSSHRFLKKQKTPVKKTPVKKKKVNAKIPTKREHPKKISREEFDNYSPEDQKSYKNKYPKNSFVGKKHFIDKKPNASQKKKMSNVEVDGINKVSQKAAERGEKLALKTARNAMKQDLKHGITKEAIASLNNVSQEDLETAYKNLVADKEKNLESIATMMDAKTLHIRLSPDDMKLFESRMTAQSRKGEDTIFNDVELEEIKKLKKKLKAGVINLNEDEISLYDKVMTSNTEEESTEEPEDSEAPERKGFFANDKKAYDKWKKNLFWRKDMDSVRKLFRGEDIEPEGRSNALIVTAVVAKYTLIGAGIFALSVGAAPAAIQLAKTLHDSWGMFNVTAANIDINNDGETDSDEVIMSLLYDSITEQIKHTDIDELKEDVNEQFTKFTSTASTSSRISYRCLPNERKLPVDSKTRWDVFSDGQPIGRIEQAPGTNRSKVTLRNWKPVIYEPNFDPLEFPHLEEDEIEDINEPYVLTNDDEEQEHNLELHNPVLMSLNEARVFMRNIVKDKYG